MPILSAKARFLNVHSTLLKTQKTMATTTKNTGGSQGSDKKSSNSSSNTRKGGTTPSSNKSDSSSKMEKELEMDMGKGADKKGGTKSDRA